MQKSEASEGESREEGGKGDFCERDVFTTCQTRGNVKLSFFTNNER